MRADGRTGRKGRGQSGERGPRGADRQTGEQAVGRTGGLGGRGLHCADDESGRRVDWAVGGGRAAVGRTGRRVDEGVGLGLKGHIPRGPFHSWAPSPLASSERECAGCLGVQWGPIGFSVKHLYLAPGLTCLV